MITITLNKIREHHPCASGWLMILAARGGAEADFDEPFPLSFALESNGLDDTLWALRCLPEHGSLWRKYAVWCARQVQHLMTDQRSVDALDVAWRYSDGLATDEEMWAARASAGAAAWASADTADATRAAAYAAARASADAAHAADATRAAQKAKLCAILDAGEWVD